MNYIHGLGSNVMDYAISDTWVLNCIVNFDLLDDPEHDSDHKPLFFTLNIDMHTNHMQNKGESQTNTHFDKSKMDLFLKYLIRDLGLLTYNDNMITSTTILLQPSPLPLTNSLPRYHLK